MAGKIINHTARDYRRILENNPTGKYNGAYYYSVEICRNIIPNVQTDRNWITINVPGTAADHAIVFIHNNVQTEVYNFLKFYRDLVLICGIPETCEKVKHLGTPIYLPLSIDTTQVEMYKLPEKQRTKEAAFAGRRKKRIEADLPDGIDILERMPRHLLLAEMAKYKKIYAVGRTAIEAKALGCEVMPYDPRFPDPDRWQVLDNLEAARILQQELVRIDGGVPDGGISSRGIKSQGSDFARVQKDEGIFLGGTLRQGSATKGMHTAGGVDSHMSKGKEQATKEKKEKWEKGFPEKNGIYKCRINEDEIVPLAHKICSINGRHRWMRLDGHDAIGTIEFINKRIGIDEL